MVRERSSRTGNISSEVTPAAPDPDLEPGFPVKSLHAAGTYHGGPSIHTLVKNIDADPQLEIVVTGLANGPLYAWNSDDGARGPDHSVRRPGEPRRRGPEPGIPRVSIPPCPPLL